MVAGSRLISYGHGLQAFATRVQMLDSGEHVIH